MAAYGLTKQFKGFVAVRDVNLSVREGSLHALIGPNGAGKTTLFNLLSGFISPTAGRILFAGENMTGRPPAFIATRGIVRSFQISATFGSLTAHENVRVALQRKAGIANQFWTSDSSLRILDRRAYEILGLVNLADYALTPARTP